MKLAVFAFTRRGCVLAQGAKEIMDAEEVRLVTMEKFGVPGFEAYRPPLNQCMEPYFRWADAILFIGSTGMAVRAIAPWVRDKKTDPAVLVMDEGGTFVISLLSGHIGGANAMTRRLAEKMGASPVITTATDVEGKFSADTWATEQGCHISDMELCKEISAAILEHPVPICGEYLCFPQLPPGLVEKEEGKLGIYVGIHNRKPFEKTLILTPRVLTLGLGCRRGTPKEAIEEAVRAVFREHDLRTEAIAQAASIDLKANEQGLLDYCKELGVPVEFFTAEELKAVPGDFSPSAFVQSVTGVDNVCERAAALAGGTLIVHKTAHNGVTVAVAEKRGETIL